MAALLVYNSEISEAKFCNVSETVQFSPAEMCLRPNTAFGETQFPFLLHAEHKVASKGPIPAHGGKKSQSVY